VDVTADLSRMPAPLPEHSPFASVAEARRFAGPLPYTFHHEPETGRLLSVRGTRSIWDPQPVAVEVRELDFFSSGRFDAEPVLASLERASYCSPARITRPSGREPTSS
jgi:hypothetical protein